MNAKPDMTMVRGVTGRGSLEVTKGSRLIPLVVLAFVALVFSAREIPGPRVFLAKYPTEAALPVSALDLFLVANVEGQKPGDSELHFLAFDSAGKSRIEKRSSSSYTNEAIDAVATAIGSLSTDIAPAEPVLEPGSTSSARLDRAIVSLKERLTTRDLGPRNHQQTTLVRELKRLHSRRLLASTGDSLDTHLHELIDHLTAPPVPTADKPPERPVDTFLPQMVEISNTVRRLNEVLEGVSHLKQLIAGAEFDPETLTRKDSYGVLNRFLSVTNLKQGTAESLRQSVALAATAVANDFPLLLWTQLGSISYLLLYSVIPGLFGLVFRRAFWRYFVTAFLTLAALTWLNNLLGARLVPPALREKLYLESLSETALLFCELIAFLLIVSLRVRRQSAAAIRPETRRKTLTIAGLCAVIALALLVRILSGGDLLSWRLAVVATLLLTLAVGLVRQSRFKPEANRPKNIVLCLDGTWNLPGMTDFGFLAETNVYKIFKTLKGQPARERSNANLTCEYLHPDGFAKQIAFYYHGVGNRVENSELGQLFGGAFGMGADAIVERAYLDVVRVYRPGDRIFIFGFSRGAAIARLVAGTIGRRGIPETIWTLRLLGRFWRLWSSARIAAEVPVAVLGAWDTVGAFGISKNILGIPFQKMNLLKNLDVSLSVRRAYHMVALDETRDSFEPTLMEPDPITPNRIVELWFSGNHANVGGGYANDKLSNVTLDFLLCHVSSGYAWTTRHQPGDESWGLFLNAARSGLELEGNTESTYVVDPDPRGALRHSTGAIYTHIPRKLPMHAVISDTVFARMGNAMPVYVPESVLRLNEELVKVQQKIRGGAEQLKETRSIDDAEYARIQKWNDEQVTLTKWSKYLETVLDPSMPAIADWTESNWMEHIETALNSEPQKPVADGTSTRWSQFLKARREHQGFQVCDEAMWQPRFELNNYELNRVGTGKP